MPGKIRPTRAWQLLVDYRLARPRVRSLPIRLWIESSSRCNLRCIMCPNQTLAASDKGLMDMDLFQRIIDQAAGFARDVNLHHRGEPFTHPRLGDMIAYARRAGLRTRFHSNGTLMTESRAAEILDAGLDFISFSVDGFEKDTYEAIRIGGRLETTVENILCLARLRSARGLQRPYIVVEKIRFRNPARPESPDAVRALKRRLLEGGVDEVIEKEEFAWAEGSAPDTGRPPRFRVCTFPWYAMAICADGTVTPCPQDYHAAMVMGNAATTPLAEIWNGDAYRELRRRFRTDLSSLPLCRKCDRLHRKTVGGFPLQYMITFVADQWIGYNRARKVIGTAERN